MCMQFHVPGVANTVADALLVGCYLTMIDSLICNSVHLSTWMAYEKVWSKWHILMSLWGVAFGTRIKYMPCCILLVRTLNEGCLCQC